MIISPQYIIQLQINYDEIGKMFCESTIENVKLNEKIDILANALRFYADSDNYNEDFAPIYHVDDKTKYDCGKTAREALEKAGLKQ